MTVDYLSPDPTSRESGCPHKRGQLPPTDEKYLDTMKKLKNVDVLIIDDFLTIGINQRGQEDLTKIIFDRDGRLPTIISSQSTAAYWLQALPDRVGADSLVSRLNNGHRIQLGDYDIRQALTPPEPQQQKPRGSPKTAPTNNPETTPTNSPESPYQLTASDTLASMVLVAMRLRVCSKLASDMYRFCWIHSSCCSASTAPTRRIMDSRFQKIPTTSVRRRISRFSRFVGLLDHTFFHTAVGVCVNARISSNDSSR